MRSHKSSKSAIKTGLFAGFENFEVLVWSQLLHYRKNILHGSFFGTNQLQFGWGQKFYQFFLLAGQANAHALLTYTHIDTNRHAKKS